MIEIVRVVVRSLKAINISLWRRWCDIPVFGQPVWFKDNNSLQLEPLSIGFTLYGQRLKSAMASWVSYTKKVLASALTSIAGELEQTAQDFNDAFYSLSRSTADEIETSAQDGHVSAGCPSSAVPSPLANSSIEAGSIPEHLRGVDIPPHNFTSVSNSETRSSITSTPLESCDGYVTAGPSFPLASSNVMEEAKSHRHFENVNRKTNSKSSYLSSSSRNEEPNHHSRLSAPSTATMTRQPEPSHPFTPPDHQPRLLHSRLSQSSPSLSPVSHEEDYSGASSDVEDSLEFPSTLPGEVVNTELYKMRTPKPRAIRGDQLRPMPFSVSTPCLVQVHKILPSCKRNFKCASSNPSSRSKKVYATYKSKHEDSKYERGALELHESTEGSNLLYPFINAEDKHKGTVGSGGSKAKRPGKVIVVVSQPPSSSDVSKLLQEGTKDNLHSESEHPNATQACSTLAANSSKDEDSLLTEESHYKIFDQQSDVRSGSPQDQLVLRTVKSPLQIERQVRPPRWPVLAPLARVLSFAYSQVVSAMLLLQEEEGSNSISSGNNRSRASSFSKELSSIRSSPPNLPPYSKPSINQNDEAVKSQCSGGSHRRQMSQLSLAGSAFSSDSFEILDLPDMESSNFVYVGDDTPSGEILQEYHLFPSKVSYSLQPSAITQSPFHPNISKSHEDSLMTTSSADFAHFDFQELISNIHHDKLNPITASPGEGSASSQEGDLYKTLAKNDDVPDTSMFESFVVLEKSSEISGASVSNPDDANDSDDGSESASFTILSDCGEE
ncbi:hypothetical protein PoB_001463600 [Plakobranchus ocellatus]|uniref:Uncharacterized protein n=1 Tax=Plakobranchus ocellatus TaxID=259542 RepID=A0AAV3YLI5_9GAST|nr:hypothetical protein PoB_001463600 [Plakobranchus ocellatus]